MTPLGFCINAWIKRTRSMPAPGTPFPALPGDWIPDGLVQYVKVRRHETDEAIALQAYGWMKDDPDCSGMFGEMVILVGQARRKVAATATGT